MEDDVQLGPLGTAATNRPTVSAPGGNDVGEIDGMMIGRGNRRTLTCRFVHHNPFVGP
jgi:hypothetical protein